MKHLTIIAAIAATLSLVGCKTTEANYRQAYETTKEHQRQRNGDLDTPALNATGALNPRPTEVANGLTLPLATTWITAKAEAGTAPLDSIQRYNVVVARFKQIFNARQMTARLRSGSFPGAFIIRIPDAYYVATATTADPQTALDGLDAARADTTIRLSEPFPFILRPAHLAR